MHESVCEREKTSWLWKKTGTVFYKCCHHEGKTLHQVHNGKLNKSKGAVQD